MNEPVRSRVVAFLERQDGFAHVGGIAKGAQVSPPSVRKYLAGLDAAGRLETGPSERGVRGYRLRKRTCVWCETDISGTGQAHPIMYARLNDGDDWQCADRHACDQRQDELCVAAGVNPSKWRHEPRILRSTDSLQEQR